MIDDADIHRVLSLHEQAYRLLLWLDRQAKSSPQALSSDEVARLAKPAGCLKWLEENRAALPGELRPAQSQADEWANLFSSFFETSFEVRHLEFGGQLLDSNLTRRRPGGPSQFSEQSVQALAVKHLLAAYEVRVSQGDAAKLAQRKSIREHVVVWTYIWELSRRAIGKGKGVVVHRLWRSISPETRKSLSVDRAKQARQAIVDAAAERVES